MSDQPGSRPDHELTDATTVFRAQRFTDPALSAPPPEPDWVDATPPIGIPLDPIPAASAYYKQYVNDVPPPSYRPSVPQTPYPDLSTSALLRQLKPAP